MLLRQSCRTGNSASEMWSQICSKINSLGAKTTLHLELMAKKKKKTAINSQLDKDSQIGRFTEREGKS